MGFFEYVPGRASGSGESTAMSGLDCECCPVLAEALSGVWDQTKSAYTTKPFSMTVWCDNGMVKVCLGVDDKHPKWFWSCSTLEALMEQAEAALKAGKGNWWQPSERKRR